MTDPASLPAVGTELASGVKSARLVGWRRGADESAKAKAGEEGGFEVGRRRGQTSKRARETGGRARRSRRDEESIEENDETERNEAEELKRTEKGGKGRGQRFALSLWLS